ncbi:MAG: heparinase II/III-family protein [Opitutaceae bacterium]|jgi:hypothetical protein|nr:heparinase II/III-family protein [Opitutaceae bacterium]
MPLPRLFPVGTTLLALVTASPAAPAYARESANLVALEQPRDLLARIAQDDTLAEARKQIIRRAREEAARPIIRRPYTFDELLAGRTIVKYRKQPANKSLLTEAEFQRSALALNDADTARYLATNLPLIAAASVLTGDLSLAEYAREQLAEMLTWAPFQRPGWSQNNDTPVLPDGGDGSWLATGFMTRAIADTVDFLPENAVPPTLRQALTARLEEEIATVQADWKTKKNWFLRAQAVYSNQWALPIEGLIRAAIFAGREQHRAAYEFGIGQLLRSLNAQGAEGEFVEGLHYANITLSSYLSLAEATARAGDERIRAHPFLAKHSTWSIHHLQPGGFYINTFDTNTRNAGIDRDMFAQFIHVLGDRTAAWTLATRGTHGGFPLTLPGLLARTRKVAPAEPPLFASYPVAAHLNWRDSWDDATAAGFWMRGGHRTDAPSHDHQDRGHVNFTVGKRPVLIEAGLFSYGIAENNTHFRSVAGHNVLQVGDLPPEKLTLKITQAGAGQRLIPKRRTAPITVHRMDATGGSASVDVSACYVSVKKWIRHAAWDRHGVDVRDEVELNAPDMVLFRWHLGLPADTPVTAQAPGHTQVGDIALACSSDTPLETRVETMPDRTLTYNLDKHACVVVRTSKPVSNVTIKTRVNLVP